MPLGFRRKFRRLAGHISVYDWKFNGEFRFELSAGVEVCQEFDYEFVDRVALLGE